MINNKNSKLKNFLNKLVQFLVIFYSVRINPSFANIKDSRNIQQYSKKSTKTQILYQSENKNVKTVKESKSDIKKTTQKIIKEEDLIKLIELANNKKINRTLKRNLDVKNRKILRPVFNSFATAQYVNNEILAFINNINEQRYNNLIDLKNKIHLDIINLNALKFLFGGNEKEVNSAITFLIILFRIITKFIEKIEDLVEILIKGLSNFIENTFRFLRKKYNKLSKRARIIFQILVFAGISYYIYTIDLFEKVLGLLSKNKALSKILHLENLISIKPKNKRQFREMLQRKIFEMNLNQGNFPQNGGYFLNKNIFASICYTVNQYFFKKQYVRNIIKSILYIFLQKNDIGMLLNSKINWFSWLRAKDCSKLVKNFYNEALIEAKEIVYNDLPLEKSRIWGPFFGYDSNWLKNIVDDEFYSRIKYMSEKNKEDFTNSLLARRELYETLNEIALKIPNNFSNDKLTDSLDLFIDSTRYGLLEPLERLTEIENIKNTTNNNSLEKNNINNKNSEEKIEISKPKEDNIKIKNKDFDFNIKNYTNKNPSSILNEDVDYIDLDLIDQSKNNKKDSNN